MGEETDIAEPLSAENVVAAEDVTANEPSKERHRKRKKLLYKSICELMEFYLGDTNLSKDRFVSQKIDGKPFVYVDISIFLTFNKMRALTTSVEEIAKALSNSEILQVSEDGTQVCRKTPILKKENEEDCTIYVEQLRPDVDHKLLTRVFSLFGTVDYVSMPRYSHNNKFKGFAFVEFRDPECAKKALETLNVKGCCLSPHMAPEELMSIKNFDPNNENNTAKSSKDDKPAEETEGDKIIEVSDSNDTQNVFESIQPEDNATQVTEVGKEKKKRKCSGEVDPSCHKKLKTNVECNIETGKESKDGEENLPSKKKKKQDLHKESEGNCETSHKKNKGRRSKTNNSERESKEKEEQKGVLETEDQSKGKKKKRKHSAENGNPEEAESQKCEKETDEPPNKKQKSDAEDATETEASQTEGEGEAGGEDAVSQKKKRKKRKKVKKDKPSVFSLGLKALPKREWRQLRNRYLNMQRDTMRTLKQHLLCSHKPGGEEREARKDEVLTLTPGTIIKVILDEPVTNAKAAKSDMRIDGEIRYVDAAEGNTCVYLRTSTADVAATLVQAKHWPNMQIIQGQEEVEYCDKIKADREHYFKKNKPIQRGRSKLLKRAERFQGKHMTTFDTPQNL